MIDVHILLMGTERQDFLEQCLESLKNEPITLHLAPGIPGDIRTARANALAKGTNPYVGWVDPDDFIIPGAYTRLLNIIGDKKFAWAKEQIWNMSPDLTEVKGKSILHRPHHMHIVHRSILNYDYIRSGVEERTPDKWVEELAADGIHDPKVGYIWRVYPTSGSRILYQKYDTEWKERQSNRISKNKRT